MTAWWAGFLLGALGAAVADGSRIGTSMLASKQWPWSHPDERVPFAVALVIRMGCASVMASVVAMQELTGWSDRPLVLFGIGLAGPSVVQQGARIARVVVRELFNARGGGPDAAA